MRLRTSVHLDRSSRVRDPDVRMWVGVAALVAFLAVGVAAFAVPRLFFADARGELSDHDVAVMETEARHWSKAPPFALQIAAARPPAQELGVPDGRVVWRTAFGVAYGETTFSGGQAEQRWQTGAAAWTWAGFAAVEVVLLGAGLILLFRDG